MRLSDIKGDKTLDVIAELIEPISSIVSDKKLVEAVSGGKKPDGQTAEEYAKDKLLKAAPMLLKSHKADVIHILSAIKGVSREQYTETLNLANLMGDLLELLNDEEFADFFTSFGTTSLASTDG